MSLLDIDSLLQITGYYAQKDIISSDEYLNDPIVFSSNGTLIPPTLTTRVDGIDNQYERDVSKFIRVELDPDGNFNKLYRLPLTTTLYDRVRYFELFDATFRELT